MKIAILLIAFASFYSCKPQPNQVFPDQEWEASLPEVQHVDGSKLELALNYLEKHSKQDGNSELMIVRNGYVIWEGENTTKSHNIYSCSKTFTSTVLGLLIDDGVLSLDEKATKYEPLLEEYYSQVTFRHFTTMTSGYSAKGDSRWPDTDYSDWSWTVYEPEEPLFPAGSAYAYWDEAQMMFGRVLTQVLQKPMIDFMKERITDPIGMGDWDWYTEKDIDGIPINNGCTNVHINASQFARYGLLYLNKGSWNGQQLLSKEWVKMATSVQVPASLPMGNTDRKSTIGPGCYGFNWWVNGKMADGNLKLPGAPEGCYYASGLNNNKCIVIPQWNMVIVRMGDDGHPENKNLVYGTFLKMVGEAIIK